MDVLPRPGETLMGTSFSTGFGGKGANQCVAAAKLGPGSVAMVGAVGDDSFGNDYLAAFRALDISTSSIAVHAGVSTGVAPIWVTPDGENSIVVVPGANGLVSAPAAASAVEALTAAAAAGAEAGAVTALLTQLEIPVEATLAAMEAGKRAGCVTIFTPAPAPTAPLPAALFRATDVLVPNVIEVGALAGVDTSTRDPATVSAAARTLLSRGCGAVVVTLGSRGSLVVLPEGGSAGAVEEIPVPAFNVGKVVDTTGAGDAFSGSLAFFYVELLRAAGAGSRGAGGVDRACLLEAVRRASYVAADSVTKKGTQKSYATKAELPAALFAPGTFEAGTV
jgi:ribokinase